MRYLPAELISDILSRLPVKDLIRCTSVSKLWNNIVRSKLFIKEHNQRAITSNNDCTLIYSSYFHDDFSSLAFSACSDTFGNEEPLKHPIYPSEERDRLRLDTNVLSACNGLILLEVESNHRMFWTEGKRYLFLWNPMIAKHKQIPYEACRDNEPGVWRRIYGLGYHSDEDDMKVLCFVQRGGFVERGGGESKVINELKVYSLASGTWKKIEKLPPSNLRCNWAPGIGMVWLNNSCVAWLMDDVADNNRRGKSFVLIFDLLKEEYRAFPSPVDSVDPGFLSSGGSLFCWRDGWDPTIWIMKDFSWSVKLSFKTNGYCDPLFFDGERFLLKLDFHEQSDENGSRHVQNVVWYTLKTHECVTKTSRFRGSTKTTFCVGSLRLLLDGDPDGRMNYFDELS